MNNELFEKMPIPKAYMKLSLPVLASCVLTLVYNMVDMFFVAKTGDTNLVAGVSLCGPVFTALIAFGDVFGLGSSSVISRLFGQGRQDDGRRLSIFAFLGGIVFGIVMAILLLAVKGPMLSLLGANKETIGFATDYYSWIALGAPFIIFALVPSNLLRTEGLANEAMIGSVTGSIVNMILDPVFIFGLGMGAGGAAVATVIGNICSDIWYLYVILRRSKLLSINPKGFFISKKEVASILGIGIPSSITNIMQSIGLMLLNRFLLPYGNDKIAAMGIVSRVTMIVVMVMVAFSFGGQPLYGYLYGAKNRERMRKTLRFAYTLICSIALVLSVILSALAPYMISIFMKDPAVIDTGTPMLRIILVGMVFIGIVMVTTCVFQSTGKAAGALALSAGRQGYIYATVIFTASHFFGYYGVLWAQPISDMITAVLAILLFKLILGKEI